MSCKTCQKKKCTCEKGEAGPIGLTGPQGPQGPIGPMPAHEWNGTQLHFQNPDGSWGPWINLQGPMGPCCVGSPGDTGGQGPAGPPGPQGMTGITGAQGIPGLQGVSIVNANIDNNGDLILTLSNGSTINSGNVRTSPSTGNGYNELPYLFKATSLTKQGLVFPSANILNLSKDNFDGYYDYGGAWSGNDFVSNIAGVKMQFVLDKLTVKNDDTVSPVTVIANIVHIVGGVSTIIGTANLTASSGGGTSTVNIVSSIITLSVGDKVRVELLKTTNVDSVNVESGTEFWNTEV